MSVLRFAYEQRERILRAARDAQACGGVGPEYDVVDLASDTGNYFWTGLTDRQARVALRLIGMQGEVLHGTRSA